MSRSLPPSPAFAREPVPRETLRRLVASRLILLVIEGGALLMVVQGTTVRLPLGPIALVLLLHALLNGAAWWRLRQDGGIDPPEMFAHLAADAAAIAALVYFSGGYANPFISLLLVPLLLCAVAIQTAYAWAMTVWVAILYSLLARYYQPLRLEVGSEAAIDLHLAGMWLNFLLTAVLVAAFVARLTAALRKREADLARAREQALRDEQLFALGMQAAAAAHDLATPMSSLMVSLKELERDYAGDDELGPSLGMMRSQAERMKVVLGRLAAAAGAARAAGTLARPLDDWLAEVFEHWQLMRPQAKASLHLTGTRPAPVVREEAILVSVLSTLLNNAADASPGDLEMVADWDETTLRVGVLDRGPGLHGLADKSGGWGVGLMLARAALERFGGGIEMTPRQGGGLSVEVSLPLARLKSS